MRKKSSAKIFVLDTSVLLFDHNAIRCFEDNDVAIPITVLEELDNFKIGNDTKNFEARAVIRYLDKLSEETGFDDWVPIEPGKGKLKIVMKISHLELNAADVFGSDKNDHRIINAALSLKNEYPKARVVLVTKDINLRIKAKAIGLLSEDYLTGKVSDMAAISEGYHAINNLESEIIHNLYVKGVIKEKGILGERKEVNAYYTLKNGTEEILCRYDGPTDTIHKVEKTFVYGIKPKNTEQAFAIDSLLNDNIQLVAIQGVAGTGKTLLALAAALEQRNKYHQIILARPIIPLSNREIGFLPGGAEEKVSPYMQPLFDNLKFIKSQFKETEKKSKILDELQQNGKLSITALAFIRGRSLSNIMFIVDEAQNLTPHEMKTIITRAGEGTKIVFTGDIAQIDTPYMDEQSNGLAYLIDKMKGQPLFSHIKLEKGQRSALANLANELL
jgi:PhoH-like ATPase